MTHSRRLGSDKQTVHRTIGRVIKNFDLSAANSITFDLPLNLSSFFFFFFQASATLSRKNVRNRGCRKQDSVIESKLIGSEHTPITLT